MIDATWGVRRATPNDLPALLRIESASFGEPWTLQILADALRDPKYLLLCLEELPTREVLGYAASWSVLDEGQLDRLAVLPGHRRRGLGRVLLDATIHGLSRAGASALFLEVRAGNASAIALYRAAGFEEVGRRRAYYEDGEDAIVLRLDAGTASST